MAGPDPDSTKASVSTPSVSEDPSSAADRDEAAEHGICVSGGGLRSAAFGLGALQALQQRRGLLRGSRAARYLSAVSGGSYIAGAYTLLNSSDKIEYRRKGAGELRKGIAPPAKPQGGNLPPFAPGTPEVEHLRRHCRYMVEEGGWKTTGALVFRAFLNLVVVASVVAYVGIVLGDLGGLVVRFSLLPDTLISPTGNALLQWLCVIPLLGLIALLLQLVARSGPKKPRRAELAEYALFFVGVPVGFLSAPVMTRIGETPALRDPEWLLDRLDVVGAAIGAIALVMAVSAFLSSRLLHGGIFQSLGGFAAGLLTVRFVQAVGVLSVSWLAWWTFSVVTEEEPDSLLFIAITLALFVPFVTFPMIGRVTPHQAYRKLLTRCFSVIRGADNRAYRPEDQEKILLSELKPPRPGSAGSFPELLVCAAANISDVGASPAGSNAVSIVFASQEVLVPAVPVRSPVTDREGEWVDEPTTMPMQTLEAYQRPTGLFWGWGPAITLSSAVAMTGAAVSPAMGKMTRKNLRALFAILNIRLGVWLPNPMREDRRRAPRDRVPALIQKHFSADGWVRRAFGPSGLVRRFKSKRKVRAGWTEFVQELFGFHGGMANNVYVTDGGHYDNLGLVELLRRRCRVVWCIDGSGDKPGRATALSEAILIAEGELGARIVIDLDRFSLLPDSSQRDPTMRNSYATGDVTYADGTKAKLVVVKLGITPKTPPELVEYHRIDRSFPHHSTLNQIFRAERFDAYRSLGWTTTCEALRDPRVSRLPAPEYPAQRD